jgi:hypothetical protein
VSVPPESDLEGRLQDWRVPSDVREAVVGAIAQVTREGATLIEAVVGDQVAVAVRGQPVAVYLSASRLSAALSPVDAERAQRADSALGLDKESDTTWLVHCRYGRLDPSRINAMTALVVSALRRHAPQPAPRAAAPRRRSSAAGSTGAGGARKAAPRASETTRRTPTKQSEEDRRNAVDAAIPRCPVPGCNLPMVGGSCGFHD